MDDEKLEIINNYLMGLEHAWRAYSFFYQCIYDKEIREKVKNIHFENDSQIQSMIIELGWSFFVNMEASLEVLIHKFKYKNIKDLLEEEKIKDEFNDDDKNGLNVYREIRNTLHHGAGDPTLLKYNLKYNKPNHLKTSQGNEVQLLYEHIHNFYELFKKIGEKLKNKYEQ